MKQINFTIIETINNIQDYVNSKLLSRFYFSIWSSFATYTAPTPWSSLGEYISKTVFVVIYRNLKFSQLKFPNSSIYNENLMQKEECIMSER